MAPRKFAALTFATEMADPNDVTTFNPSDAQKIGGLCVLHKNFDHVMGMTSAELDAACKPFTVETPTSCRNLFIRQIKCLESRFHNTTSWNDDGEFFCEDINQLMLDLSNLLKAGIANAHCVSFQKWEPSMGSFVTSDNVSEMKTSSNKRRKMM